jgi:hypothetical protein
MIRLHRVQGFEGGINDKPAIAIVEIDPRPRQIRTDWLVHKDRRMSGAAGEGSRENYAQGTFQCFHMLQMFVVISLYSILPSMREQISA